MEAAKRYEPAIQPDRAAYGCFASPYYGLWYKDIEVEGIPCRYHVYTPRSYRPQARVIFLFLPKAADTEAFLAQSEWVGLSEDNGLILVLLASEDDTLYKDAALSAAWYEKAAAATFNADGGEFCALSVDSRYIVGYGEGAESAAAIGLRNPSRFSGLALYGPCSLTADELAEIGAELCPDGRNRPAAGFPKKNCPLPAYLSSEAAGNAVLLAYLKTANDVEPEALQKEGLCIYIQKTSIAHDHVNHKPVSRLIVEDNPTGASVLFKELFGRVIRFPENPYGALRTVISAEDIGLKFYRRIMDHASHKEPVERLFALYVPSCYDGQTELPLVVATHGFSATYEYFFKNTEFWRVAEERGFIVAFTQATPNDESRAGTPRWRSGYLNLRKMPGRSDTEAEMMSEVAYFRWVVETVEADYKVDRTRVYCTGHSNGGGMTYDLSETMKDVFAAAAQVGFAARQFKTIEEMPSGGLHMPSLNLECSDDRETDPDDPETSLHWELLYRRKENGMDPLKPCMTEVYNGKLRIRNYLNHQGFPIVNYVEYDNACHAYFPEISYYVWDHFLCNYSRDAEGNSYYRGILITDND